MTAVAQVQVIAAAIHLAKVSTSARARGVNQATKAVTNLTHEEPDGSDEQCDTQRGTLQGTH
jgi:hypothetical protein